MKIRTHRARATAPAAALVTRSRLLAALIAATLTLAHATAAASGGLPMDLRVGHAVKPIVVQGSAQGEDRAVDVHL